ncbi:hypothetical protein ACQPZZ_28535 [Microbispora sp. CA-135349]|uniref:hypothetical protein n=1 Tax=Microbispora sp. CA-135349 TaxID=3239953 RepID=UPI003D926160
MHYFQKNAGQILRIPADGEHPPDPPADPARTFCRMEFTIGVGTYGLRNDSLEIIRLGDLVFLFEERPAYAPPRPYHQGNTSDQPDAEYTWRAHLAGCATAADLANGFTIEHINYADDCCTDNWSLRSLRIRDLDTGRILLDHAAPPGRICTSEAPLGTVTPWPWRAGRFPARCGLRRAASGAAARACFWSSRSC